MKKKLSVSEAHAMAPKSAEFVKAMREAFGEIKVTYVSENGLEIGEPSKGGSVCTIERSSQTNK